MSPPAFSGRNGARMSCESSCRTLCRYSAARTAQRATPTNGWRVNRGDRCVAYVRIPFLQRPTLVCPTHTTLLSSAPAPWVTSDSRLRALSRVGSFRLHGHGLGGSRRLPAQGPGLAGVQRSHAEHLSHLLS